MSLPFPLDFGRLTLALALSVVLYLYAVNETDPETTRVTDFDVPVQVVNIPTNLVVADPPPAPIRVRVSAPVDVFAQLRPDNFVAQVNATDASAGTNDLPINLHWTETRVRDAQPVPARATVQLEEVEERSVPVRVNVVGQTPAGYVLGTVHTDPPRVTVRGPSSVARRAVEAVIDVTVERLTVGVNGAFTPRILDDRGNEVRGLTVNPPAVNVQIPITQQAQFKEVGVRPNLNGQPAPGYFLEPVTVDPPTTTLVGEASALEGTNFVLTEPITIADLASTVVRRVALQAPEHTFLLQQGQTVLVTIRATQLTMTQTLRVPPTVINMQGNVFVANQLEPVEITISGPAPTLSNLSTRDFRVTLDVNNRVPGRYVIDAHVANLPSGMTVERIEPAQVVVELGGIPPTATPVVVIVPPSSPTSGAPTPVQP